MTSPIVNLPLLLEAARALEPLTPEMMFVGGSVVGILAPDPSSAPRPTDDVDVVLEAATTIDYQTRVGDRLRRLGFEVDARPRAPLCRWTREGLVVDVMPVDGEILGFRNAWYRSAFSAREPYPLTENLTIHVISAPYFVATKLEAFSDRGPRLSRRVAAATGSAPRTLEGARVARYRMSHSPGKLSGRNIGVATGRGWRDRARA